MPGMGEQAQFPLNAIGRSGQDAFLGVEKVFFTGSTGLIGTMFGVPGLSATRVSTGLYTFVHDKVTHIDVIAGLECPTGTYLDVNIPVATKGSPSGTFQVQTYNRQAAGFGTGVPSIFFTPQNPATGTVLKLMIYGSPITPF